MREKRPMTFLKFRFLLLIVVSMTSLNTLAGESGDLYFIDAHSQADSEQTLNSIIQLMDKAGVKRTLLSGRNSLTSGDVAKFAGQHPGRITASVRTKGGAYQNNKKSYYESLEQEVASGQFGAIAELLVYHAQKGNKAPEVIVRPADRRVQTALAHAKKQSWPLVIHIEFASLSPVERIAYMAQLEELLDQSPDHPFMLIHMGQLRSAEVQRLIETHNNVHFLTSHCNPVVTADSKQPWTLLFEGDILAPDWKSLVIRYPDRFVLAFDNVWPEHWGDYYLQQAAYWRKAFAALPAEVAHKVAHGNAERLWKLPAQDIGGDAGLGVPGR